MKVIIDDKIPFIKGWIEPYVEEVVYLPGAHIKATDVKDADALIIRTRTICNKELLEGSKVSFIATATIGFDHLDTEYLKSKHITWTNCPGCNANSVGQYIRSSLLLLEKEKGVSLCHTSVGLIGYGNVGKAVAKSIAPLGVRIFVNDPPLQESGTDIDLPGGRFYSLQELQENCQILSFHTPLIRQGEHATFHLADARFFKQLKPGSILINTSRGEVVDNEALIQALKSEMIADAIIDTWENEPNIHQELLERVYIGTPHIAGYSTDGKAHATQMALEAFFRHFHFSCSIKLDLPLLPDAERIMKLDYKSQQLALYNPLKDAAALKMAPDKFEYLRGNYPIRREEVATL